MAAGPRLRLFIVDKAGLRPYGLKARRRIRVGRRIGIKPRQPEQFKKTPSAVRSPGFPDLNITCKAKSRLPGQDVTV